MVPLKNSINFNFYLFFFTFSIGILDSTYGSQHNQHLSSIPFKVGPSSSISALLASKPLEVTTTCKHE
jgi:hypothetical protein